MQSCISVTIGLVDICIAIDQGLQQQAKQRIAPAMVDKQ
jgi:hypothetical protein